MSDDDEVQALMLRQAEVRGDVERLQEQAGPLASVWTGMRMDGPDVVVLLTDPTSHEDALRALLERPERVRFERSAHTRVELDEVHRRVVESLSDESWRSHGPGLERVHLTLYADQAALAEQLHQRFGDALEITLGRHRYPFDTDQVLRPPAIPASTVRSPELTCTVIPDRDAWPSGEVIRGRVLLTNDGPEPVGIADGATGVLLDDHGRVVGNENGAHTLALRVAPIQPGGRDTVHFIAGSETSDPRLGATLPPGTYRLVIALHLYDLDSIGRRTRHTRRRDTIATDPIPLHITTPDPEQTATRRRQAKRPPDVF